MSELHLTFLIVATVMLSVLPIAGIIKSIKEKFYFCTYVFFLILIAEVCLSILLFYALGGLNV